jgi:DEAD/DEAH box helicase domain-containing protein
MQFMENFIAVSELGLSNKTYLALPLPALEKEEKPVDAGSYADGWQAVLESLHEFADEEEMAFVESLRDKNIAVPDVVGNELMENGSVIDMVELAWSSRKIALVLSSCEEARENIIKAGWTVFDEKEENVEVLFGEAFNR